MKKVFLFLMAVLLPLAGFAASVYDELGNLVNPPGKEQTFQLYAWVRGGTETSGRKFYEAKVRFNGKDVYFKDICPTAETGTWVKGSYIDDNTIRILPQDYYTEKTDAGNYTTSLVMWHGTKVGFDQEGTRAYKYDLVVGKDSEGHTTLTCADTNDWLSVADTLQQGVYDFSSELKYTWLKDAPSHEIITKQPAGKRQRFSLQANMFSAEDNDFWADFGYKADVVWGDDGNVYFSTLTPDNTEATGWIKGTYDKKTGIITVASPQCVGYLEDYDTYIYLANYDYANSDYLSTPLYFKVDTRGWIMATEEAEEQYPATFYMQGSVQKGLCAINQYLTLMPVEEEPVSVPEGLDTQSYVLTYTDIWNGAGSRLVTAGVKNNVVYVKGIDEKMPDAWIKGSVADGKVVFQSRQLLTQDDSNLYIYFNGGKYVAADETPQPKDCLVMDYNASTGKMTGTNTGDYKTSDFIIDTYAGEIYTNVQSLQVYDVALAPQGEWTPASPANPSFDVEFHFQDEYGNAEENPYFVFYVPNVDVNGAYLDTQKLYYRFFWDMDQDSPYTFSTDDYIYIDENTTLMPWSYYDDYDITVNGTKHVVYMYNTEGHDYISIQSVYEYDDESYESEFVTRNIGPYIKPTGIESVSNEQSATNNCDMFNLMGQKINKSAKGLVIHNGKKFVR